MLLFDDYPIKVGARLGDLLKPIRQAWSVPVLDVRCVAKLPENEFRVTDHSNVCRHMEADPRRRSVGLNVSCRFVPSRCLAEFLAAPEPKADRQNRIGAPGQQLPPWTSDCKGVVLRHGALPVRRLSFTAAPSATSATAARTQASPRSFEAASFCSCASRSLSSRLAEINFRSWSERSWLR